jgi:hypothetical protein
VLECPICRQSYDGRVQIFVPPHHETFDTVACAKCAAEVWGWDQDAWVPVIEVADARSQTHAASAAPRRRLATLAARVLTPGQQAALATGICLLAAGTAASIYSWPRPSHVTAHSSAVAAGIPHTRQTISRPPGATRRSSLHSARTRPETKAIHPERPITAGVSYQAASFPLAFRITPPDGTWAGAQWKTSSRGQPAFGWAQSVVSRWTIRAD